MTDLLRPDYSTINLGKLKAYGEYKLPASYELARGMGSACFLDPPGYPSYFVRSVYTRFGNEPRKGVTMVITAPDDVSYPVGRADEGYDRYQSRLHRLWVPLSLDHPRTQAWIADLQRHYKNCWVDASGAVQCGPKPEGAPWAADTQVWKYYAYADFPAGQVFKYTGNWYERLPRRPEPDECPGEQWGWGKYQGRHPVNGKHCQVCGWHEEP